MTIKDIARLAGVSVSTVSKVMNGKDKSISQETRDKVLQTAKEYNYTPFASFMTQKTKTFQIGILFNSMGTVKAVLNGILSQACQLGYTLSISASNGDPQEELKAIAGFCRNKVDAILWETISSDTLQGIAQLEAAQIPYLTFNSTIADSLNLDYLYMGYQATKTMIDYKHTEIACLLSPGTRSAGFFEGYRKCLFDHGLTFHQELVFEQLSPDLIHKIFTHEISGVVCSHYSTASALYKRCNNLQYWIPHDCSMIALKDDSCSEADDTPISTFTIPHFEFGVFLCNRIVALIEQKEQEEQIFLPDIHLDNIWSIDLPYSQRRPKITVVGSINIDHYLKVPQLPTSGKSVSTSGSTQYPGGKATNQAIGAAKLGHAVSILGNVGSDLDAHIIYDALRKYSVDISGLIRYPNFQTGRAYIIVEPGGDSLITIHSGASEFLYPESLRHNAHLFENTAFCLISTEIPTEAAVEACRLTHKFGGQTIIKPSSCNHLSDELLSGIDILIPNQNEIEELCPQETDLASKAEFFLKKGVKIVIITLGAEGCFVKTPSFEKKYDALTVTALDNTGAGDAFICAFASYMLYGFSLDASVQIATYAAGFSTTKEGVAPSLVDKSTLEAYIRQKNPSLLNLPD